MPDVSCLGVKKGRDGKTPFERLHGEKPTQKIVPFGEKVLATEPMNRMNPRYQYGIWLGMRNKSAECFIGNADGVLRAREFRRLEFQDRWDTEAISNVIGVPWRMTDGQWTPFQSLHCRSRVYEYRGRESPSKTSTSSEPRLDAQAAMQSGQQESTSTIVAECELRSNSQPLRMGRERLD